MTYKGHVVDGKVVFDEPAPLANGTPVLVEVVRIESAPDNNQGRTLLEQLATVAGKADGLPVDWSERHDDYLREEHGE